MLLTNAANLITPQLFRTLIDRGILALDLRFVWLAMLGLIAVALTRGLFNFLQGYWTEVASHSVAFELRNAIFEKLQRLSFSYHDRAQTGKLMTRMTSDVEQVRMFVGQGFLQMVSALVMLIGTVAILMWMNWVLALIVLAIVPAILLVLLSLVRAVLPASHLVQQSLGELNTILQENLSGLRIVRSFSREPYELSRYRDKNEGLLSHNLNLLRIFTSSFPLVFFLTNAGVLSVVWVGGLHVMGERLSLGELAAFISYQGYLLMPIFMIGMSAMLLSRAQASAQRIFEVMDAQSEVEEAPDAVPLPRIAGRVEFEDVHFRYAGSSQDVLAGISFQVAPGQTVAILGKTGSGKSSIINLIPRFYDVTWGRVLVDGRDVREVTISSLRSQIGIVLQETTLFSGTVRENIAFGRPEAGLEVVMAAAKAADAHEFIARLPHGYETRIGERGLGLSGGQKQRLAIARALLVDPRILILDDSTSAVDLETEYKIRQALRRLMHGRTSFIIAQRLSTVREADLILVIDDGRLVAQGRHDELIRTSELYVSLLQTQLAGQGEETPSPDGEFSQ